MKWKKRTRTQKIEFAQDIVKSIIQWAVVSVLGFVYWMAVLLLISIFMLNIWHTSFEDILRYGFILAAITSVGYAGVLVYRRFH